MTLRHGENWHMNTFKLEIKILFLTKCGFGETFQKDQEFKILNEF